MAKEINDYVVKKTAGQKSIKDIYVTCINGRQRIRDPAREEFPGLLKSATGIDITATYNKWQQPIER